MYQVVYCCLFETGENCQLLHFVAWKLYGKGIFFLGPARLFGVLEGHIGKKLTDADLVFQTIVDDSILFLVGEIRNQVTFPGFVGPLAQGVSFRGPDGRFAAGSHSFELPFGFKVLKIIVRSGKDIVTGNLKLREVFNFDGVMAILKVEPVHFMGA